MAKIGYASDLIYGKGNPYYIGEKIAGQIIVPAELAFLQTACPDAAVFYDGAAYGGIEALIIYVPMRSPPAVGFYCSYAFQAGIKQLEINTVFGDFKCPIPPDFDITAFASLVQSDEKSMRAFLLTYGENLPSTIRQRIEQGEL
jgi:hypothetical protein